MNKMKFSLRSYIFSILVLISNYVFSQDDDIKHIKTSGKYYYGQATAETPRVAEKDALQFMIESISVEIKSEFIQIIKESNKEIESYTKNVVNTYSAVVVHDYSKREIKNEVGKFEILVYISKEKMQQAFDNRKNIIYDFLKSAENAEKDGRISDVLRYYYWSLILARSHPDNRKLTYDFGNGHQMNLITGISDKMESVFSRIIIEVSNISQRNNSNNINYDLRLSYNGKPIQRLDYQYDDGKGYTDNYVSASGGIGQITLSEAFARELAHIRIRIEYIFENIAKSDPDMKLIIDRLVDIPYFRSADKRIPIRSIATQNESSIRTNSQTLNNKSSISLAESIDSGYQDLVDITMNVVTSISKRNVSEVKSHFTEEGFSIFEKLITNGNVTVLENQLKPLRVIKAGNEMMVRSVPMVFAYSNNRERFVEQVVFSFDGNKKINSLSYALSDVAIKDILSRPGAFGSDEDKYFLIKFMEEFKTAYALKRDDFLEAIFAENALIIVGREVKRSNDPIEKVKGMYAGLKNNEIEYIQLSKAEYIDRLKKIFRRNEFINIRFEENIVTKTERKNKIYGIQIAQHYYSSTYADKGYLFLMIDLNDSINPKIYVRSWQPHKNPDGSIYGLHDFRF